MNFKQQILRYGLAMSAAAFDSAIHSCAAFFGVAGAHAISESIPALRLQQCAAIFAVAFGRATWKYLDEHPIGKLIAEYNVPATPDAPAPAIENPKP